MHHSLASKTIFSTKALVFKLVNIEVTDGVIVELVPPLIALVFVLSNEGIVVARVCSASVHDNTLELELIVVLWMLEGLLISLSWGVFSTFSRLLLLLSGPLPSAETLLSIWQHIELERELPIVVDLDSHHAIEIKLEPLQSDDKVARQLLDASPFQGIDLLVALSAQVGIVPFKHISLDKGAQTFLDRPFVFDWHTERHKWLTSLILVRTALANHLRGKCASKVGLDCLLLSTSLDCALKSIQEHLQEFINVHLLQHVGGLAVPVFESMAEAFGVDVLLL